MCLCCEVCYDVVCYGAPQWRLLSCALSPSLCVFQLQVRYDLEAEFWGSFEASAASRHLEQQKTFKPVFSIAVMRASTNRIIVAFCSCLDAQRGVWDVLRWDPPWWTLLVFTSLITVCLRGCLFQFAMFLPLLGMLRNGAIALELLEPLEAAPAPAPDPGAEDVGSPLAWLCYYLFYTAEMLEAVANLLRWRDPQTSWLVTQGLAAAFALSCVLPVRVFLAVAFTYIFLLEGLYVRFPEFRQRFGPARLVGLLVAGASRSLGLGRSEPAAVCKATGLLYVEVLCARWGAGPCVLRGNEFSTDRPREPLKNDIPLPGHILGAPGCIPRVPRCTSGLSMARIGRSDVHYWAAGGVGLSRSRSLGRGRGPGKAFN